MGCNRSKLNNNVCEKDETTAMHIDYINKEGIDKYYKIMEMESQGGEHNSFQDHSSNLNVGLINIEEKSETDVENYQSGFTIREWIELAVVLIIAIGALRVIYKCCVKRRKKRQLKKNKTLQEVVKSVAIPNREMLVKTVTQVPATESTPDNKETQIVPYIPEKSLPVSVNVSRLPILPSSYYA